MSAQYGCAGFSCLLEWDATANVPLIEFPQDQAGSFDFAKFGGVKNNAGTGATGDVMFTTVGYTDAGGGGFLYLWFKKT